MKTQNLFLIAFLIGWYYFCYLLFFQNNPIVGDSPQLRNRLGTILWHSSDRKGRTGEAIFDSNAVAHTYCYYPKGETKYKNKSGEYIIKREDSGDCSGWYGAAIFHEGSWVSEREKIWWSKNQMLEESLSNLQQKPSAI